MNEREPINPEWDFDRAKAFDDVVQAANQKDTWRWRYVEVIRAARAQGIPVADIAQAAGVTREAIYRLLKRAERRGQALNISL